MNAKDNILLSNIADTFSHTEKTHQETKGFSFSSEGDSYSMSFGKDTADIFDKTSASIHHQQNIQASSISINANTKASIESSNLIASNGDISISASDVSLTSLKDNFDHQKDEKYTSNKVGISIPKSYAGELGKGAAKSTMSALGKGMEWLGDHLDASNPDNKNSLNHPDLLRNPGKWLKKGSDQISSPSLSQINHLEFGVGFTHTQNSSAQLSSYSQNSSSDLIGNNISINAKNQADIISSNLTAQNDINLSAKALNITSSANTASNTTSSTSNSSSISLTANIGKETSVNVQGQLEHLTKQDSTTKLTQVGSLVSSKNLHINTSEDTHIEGSSINATNSTAIKAKSFTLTSSENKLSTFHRDSSAGGAMKVSYNGSFGGEISANYNHSNTNTQTLTHNASILNPNKLFLTTTEDSNIIGSSINAVDADIQSQSLNLFASKDSFSSNSSSDDFSASLGANLSNLASMKLQGKIHPSSIRERSATYNNALLNVSNLKLNTQKDLNIKGGNLAVNHLQASIKGDMNLESLANTHTKEYKDFSLGASGNGSNFKPSFASSPSDSSTSIVKTQSGINAKDSLQMNVEGHTDLKGAYINVEDKEEHPITSTFKTNTLSSTFITNSSDMKSKEGIRGDKKERNSTKALSSISSNIYLEQNTNTSVNRSSPINKELKEVSMPTATQKSLFDELGAIKDINQKISNLADKAHTSFKKENKPHQSSKEKLAQAFKDTDKGIDLGYSDGRAIVSSIGEFMGEPKVKKVADAINDYISLTYNTKEMGKGIAKGFTQSFKEDAKGIYNFSKPLSDSILDIGVKNTTDVLQTLIENKTQAPKVIFNNAWNTTKKQSEQAAYGFMHKVLWE